METQKTSGLSLFLTLTFRGAKPWFRVIGTTTTFSSARFSSTLAGALIAGTILLCGKAQAQDTWQQTASGTYTWTTPTTNWSPSVPNASGVTANLESALAGTETVDLGTAITVGTLNIGATSGAFKFNLAAGGGSLTLNSGDSTGGAGAAITEESTANGDTISAGIIMADTATTTALTITNDYGGQFTLSGGITGSGNLVLEPNAAAAFITANLNGGIDNTGTVTFDSTASTVTSTIDIGSNVTEVLNDSSAGATLQIGALALNSNGTTLEYSAASGHLDLNVAVSGTGNLTLDNTTSNTGAFSIAGGSANQIDMTGTLTTSGPITVGSAIGTAVTSITDTAGKLILTQNNPFNNSITITTGTVTIADASGTVFGDLGDNGLSTSTGTFSGGISIASGATFIWQSSAAQTISGGITGAGALTVSTASFTPTAANLILTGSNSYTGETTISSTDTLQVGTSTTNGSISSSTGGFSISGTLQLNNGSAISSNAGAVALSGGTIAEARYSSTKVSNSLGTLSVSAASILNFGLGSGADNTLTFAGITGSGLTSSHTLTIDNWQNTGLAYTTASTSDNGADDQLLYGGTELTSAQLADVIFNINSTTYSASQFSVGGGEYEIVADVTAVPEPPTTSLLLVSLVLVGCWKRRHIGHALGLTS